MLVEIPGMTREAIDAMASADVEAYRWALFSRALEPTVNADHDDTLQQLSDLDHPPSEHTLKARRAEQREAVMQAKFDQARIRVELLLDDEEDDDGE